MKDIGWKRHTGRCDGFDWLDRQLASLLIAGMEAMSQFPIGGLHGVFRAWLDNKAHRELLVVDITQPALVSFRNSTPATR
jgi:hypothetical protein